MFSPHALSSRTLASTFAQAGCEEAPFRRVATPCWSHRPARVALAVVGLLATMACGVGPEGEPAPDDETTALRQFDAHVEDSEALTHDDPLTIDAVQVITLVLETREGTGSLGYAFAQGAMVPAEEADIVLSSWDCGARGRWVTVDAQGAALCQSDDNAGLPDFETCNAWSAPSVQVGGSHPSVELDGAFYAQAADGSVYELTLRERTETPGDWYEADDLSFEVELEVKLLHAAVRCREL